MLLFFFLCFYFAIGDLWLTPRSVSFLVSLWCFFFLTHKHKFKVTLQDGEAKLPGTLPVVFPPTLKLSVQCIKTAFVNPCVWHHCSAISYCSISVFQCVSTVICVSDWQQARASLSSPSPNYTDALAWPHTHSLKHTHTHMLYIHPHPNTPHGFA